MNVLDIFGKIDGKIIISKKLGIVISNLEDEWKSTLRESILEEIEKREKQVAFIKHTYDRDIEGYDLKHIVSHSYYKGIFDNDKMIEDVIDEIVNCLTCIYIDSFEKSVLIHKNRYIDNPTCETSFEKKFIDFFDFLDINRIHLTDNVIRVPFLIFSLDEWPRASQIVHRLSSRIGFRPSIFTDYKKEREYQIEKLVSFGHLVDNYLVSKDDFLLLNYLIEAIHEDPNPSAYYIFKMVSLIEMLIKNPKNISLSEIDINDKIPQFIPDTTVCEKERKIELALLLKRIRNKIGHGDFKGLHKQLEEYAEKFMKDFHFDYYELSRENWIFSGICINLNSVVANIIWQYLIMKDYMQKLKMV